MVSVQPSLAEVPDAEVLARFIERREEVAFAELVRRHGPMVRAACRRALGASPDAEDAFQAVFVILARKAASVRNAALLGPWLHTIAVRAANRARKVARRHQDRERQVATMPEPALPPPPPEPSDWLPLLDAAIQRLPERWRVPLVLCELEGKSRAEAARQLGLSEGTLSSRLARAREALRRRLCRAGTVVAGAGLSAAFAYCHEAMPAQLLTTTTQAALSGVTSTSVAALTQGVLQAMLLTKLKTALLLVLAVAALSGVLAVAGYAIVQPQDAKADKEKLQGTWEFVSAQTGGKEAQGAEAEQMKMMKVVFKGDKVTAKFECTYAIDPGKKPKEFDLKVDEGPELERGTWKGIYELKGDELTLCMALPNQNRPTEFASKEGEFIMLLKLKRAK
jgi:RNA polymerase sigma factor (sigma-70 family)